MKYILQLVLFLSISLSVKAQLPNIEVKDMDKNWIELHALMGEKLTVVDFWASYCKPCVLAIPKLNEIHKAYASKGVSFIGINTDGPRNQSKVKPFVKTLNVSYPILLDPDQELVKELNVNAFPTLIIYSAKGKELYVHEGFNSGDEKIIEEELKKLLNK